ncbi:MAG: DUF2079 domain-containing protein [Anaerolineaceae bacterium]|nr:DUF2079 domain-containing protein [Anaerolineaceae bacterium]
MTLQFYFSRGSGAISSNSAVNQGVTLPTERSWLTIDWRKAWPDLVAWTLIILYIITFTWLAILRHASFNSSGFDLGIYDQVVWNTLHGRILFYTTTGIPALHLSNHASFILILVAPFYLIYSGPEMLLFLQAAAIGLGGLPLFWLAREKLGSPVAALSLLSAYLLFPTLQIVTLWDFHPPVLAVGFFMFAFYFLVKRRAGWFLLFAILAMSCKEQLPLQVAFLGLYAIIRYRDWRLGLTTIILSMTWFFVVMLWVIPANSVTGDHLFIGYYADLGDSPAEIVTTAITRPDLVIKNLWQPAKLKYLFDVLTPFAYLPLLGLPVLLIGAPSFAINMLSANSAMYDATGGQYGADVAPWLAFAALYGLVYLNRGVGRRWPQAQRQVTTIASVILLAVALIWQLFRGYSPLALDPPHWEITDHDRLAQRFIDQIPPDASLAAQGKLYPHLSNRLIAYQLPDVNDAEYVFVDVTTGTWPVHPNDIWAKVHDLLASGDYGVLDAADGYLLLKRGLPNTDYPPAFYDFARAPEAQPQYPVQVDFSDDLRLLGYDVIDDPRRAETAVRLYWQALKPLDRHTRLYPFFLNDQGQVIETTEQRPLLTQLWFPPHLWQPGEIVTAETMPWALGDRWSLAAGILTGDNWSDWSQRIPVQPELTPDSLRRFEANTWVRLGSFERQGRELVEITPAEPNVQPTHTLQANFDHKMELQGYDLSPVTEAGPDLVVTLHWRALSPMPQNYNVFVHLVDAEDQLITQHDGEPWWELPLPTSTWQPGETLRDRHVLALPADLPPGTYRLQAGVYYWEDLERLPVLENGVPVNNFVELGSLELGQ